METISQTFDYTMRSVNGISPRINYILILTTASITNGSQLVRKIGGTDRHYRRW